MTASALVTDLLEECEALEQSGQIEAAFPKALRALETARDEGKPVVLAAALVAAARLRFRMGQYKEAEGLARETLELAAPDAVARVNAWQVLANCAAETDSLAEAEVCYRNAADLARELGHARSRMAALHGLAAAVYIPRGQFDLAVAADEEVYRLACEHCPGELATYPQIALAMAYQLTGRWHQAHALLDSVGGVVAPGSLLQGYVLGIGANLALDEGELEAARSLLTDARSIAEATGEPWLNVTVRLGMSRSRRLAGDGAGARTWAEDALAFASRVGYRHLQGRALVERARAAWLGSDTVAAEADLLLSIKTFDELGAAFDLARSRLLLAALLHQRGREEAPQAWGDAVRSILSGGYAFLLEQERSLAFPMIAAHLNHLDAALARACALLLKQLQSVPPQALRVVMLGRYEVWQGNRCVDRQALRRRRAGELLALLLLSPGRSLTFDEIAEAIWPDKEPAASRALFHHASSALRHVLEPDLPEKFPSRYVEAEDGRITLHLPPGSWLDIEAFEACCHEGQWHDALGLYSGELLPGYRYAAWITGPREHLALLYQRALLAAAEGLAASERHREALDACRRILALEPWHERAVLLGMHACIALNDRAGALRLYHGLEKRLQEELDTAPQEELQLLYRSLIDQGKLKGIRPA